MNVRFRCLSARIKMWNLLSIDAYQMYQVLGSPAHFDIARLSMKPGALDLLLRS